jgi:hypothetical protein
MFAGAYWSQRAETREQAAQRLVSFLGMLSRSSEELAAWYLKGRTKAAALGQPLASDIEAIAAALKTNRKDVGRDVIPELGYSLGVWNGHHASLSVTIGAHSPYVSNSVVLSEEPSNSSLPDEVWRGVLRGLIAAFEPDHATVTSSERLAKAGSARPWEVGWITYERGGQVVESRERR